MRKNSVLLSTSAQDHSELESDIRRLRSELEGVESKTRAFEAVLRSHLEDLLIEERELFGLYKQQKLAKKSKRLDQKKRGKNYVEPVGLVSRKSKTASSPENESTEKERKRLYREAMIHVHPDKYSLSHKKLEMATELTIQLIEIYRAGNLADMQTFHAHLFSQTNLTERMPSSASLIKVEVPDDYLIKQKHQLEQQLAAAKEKHTYHVLTHYEDPLTFAEELKTYYADRILKLRRRTRTT